MKREIKFRAWDGQVMYGHTYIQSCWTLEDLCRINPSDGFKIMQYTGLKDKNGKEIYEGDILDLPVDGEFSLCEITFTVDRDFNGWEITPQHVQDGAEVIGNIHENPELLG